MKRMDRLMAILMALQQNPATAHALARQFEVSKRTILRDMQSLAEMGIPIYAVSGPGGGFRLMEGFHLPPLQLNAQEALTVLFALRFLTRLSETPFHQARWTVLNKIRAILPKETLRQVEPMLECVEVEVPQRKTETPNLSKMLEYTAKQCWIETLYRSERHHRTLQLRPERIYTAHGFWYCKAYSVKHGESRTFRVDRFDDPRVIDKPQEADFPSDAEHSTDESTTRILARLTYRGALLAEQDYHIGDQVKQVSEEVWELEFQCPAPEYDWAVRFFYTLGMDAEVIEPKRMRADIHAMALRLCVHYRNHEKPSGGTDD